MNPNALIPANPKCGRSQLSVVARPCQKEVRGGAARVSKKSGSAQIAIKKIKEIYWVEKELRENDLDDKALKVRSSSRTGKAISYTLGQWKKIARYVESPHLTPDNNAVKRGIKPFVIGRKNWLFAGSLNGAKACSFFFSLIETAKDNNLNPYGSLKWIFDQAAVMDDDFD